MIEPHAIDHYLADRDDDIVPSAGFADAVMESITREASAPPPIGFPWKRALPGLLGTLVLLGAILRGVSAAAVTPEPAWSPVLDALSPTGSLEAAGLVLALLLTLSLALMTLRLMRT